VKNMKKDELPSVFDWIKALTSDLVALIFYIAIAAGVIFLLVKLVKYFWYM
tara:strand:- start:66 stop:218 length:153 start_codon:yes stop_codon:yes gene_type:complete